MIESLNKNRKLVYRPTDLTKTSQTIFFVLSTRLFFICAVISICWRSKTFSSNIFLRLTNRLKDPVIGKFLPELPTSYCLNNRILLFQIPFGQSSHLNLICLAAGQNIQQRRKCSNRNDWFRGKKRSKSLFKTG